MIPGWIQRRLSNATGVVGDYYAAYKDYRWGDPYVRLVASLADRTRLAVDVGAHLGEYTFFMRRHAAACIAFEANPALVRHLQRRFGHSVDIRPDAVSDHKGTTTLRIPQSAAGTGLGRATIEAANPLHGDFTGVDVVTVHTIRLDDVIDRPIGLLKVDVEGHELAVLRGATRILTKDRPNLVLELEDRHRPGAVPDTFAYLQGLGYAGSYLEDGILVPATPGKLGSEGPRNYVFKYQN